MRLKLKRPAQHRANAADRIVQTPTMARRPLAANPVTTQMLPVIRESGDYLTRELPKVSPSALPSVHPHTPLTPTSGHPAPSPLNAVQALPAIREQQPTADSTTTQILPKVPSAVAPSARHVDPAQLYYQRTFVEDDGMDPQARGRHVLDELKSEPDVAALVAVQQRAHAVLDVYDPMRRAEVAARANDERMLAFTAKCDAWGSRYEREFESWASRFKQALAETRARWATTTGRTNAARLEMDYNDGGTAAALYTKDQLAAEIARRDAAGSGQHR